MDWTERLTEKLDSLLGRKAEAAAPEAQPQMSGPVLHYTEQVIDHFSNPRNVGEMDPDEADGVALVGDPLCGDQMELWIKVDKGRISQVRFKSYGCPGAIATSSMATDLASGSRLEGRCGSPMTTWSTPWAAYPRTSGTAPCWAFAPCARPSPTT